MEPAFPPILLGHFVLGKKNILNIYFFFSSFEYVYLVIICNLYLVLVGTIMFVELILIELNMIG